MFTALGRLREILADRGMEVRDRYGIPLSTQAQELLYYYWRFGLGRSEYYMFEMFKSERTEAERKSFLSQNAWKALSDVLNGRRPQLDKHALALRFADARIPFPRTLAYSSLAPTARQRKVEGFVPFDQIPRVVGESGCVIKRDHSFQGRHVLVFERREDGVFVHVDGRRLGLDEIATLLGSRGVVVVQERLTNHPDLASLRLPSLATLRVVTYIARDCITVARAALKLPIGRQGIDNYHAGGIAAPIDLDTGVVGPGIPARGLDWVAAHPETNRTFAGLQVPCWDGVLSIARRAAAAVPEYACLGWDIAVTPDGPVVIEGNDEWGTDIVQRPHRDGIWKGPFRDWCLQQIEYAHLDRRVRRWLR